MLNKRECNKMKITILIKWFNKEKVINKESIININIGNNTNINNDFLSKIISDKYKLNNLDVRIKGYLILN